MSDLVWYHILNCACVRVQVFRTGAFTYDEAVEADFHDPTVTPLSQVPHGPEGIRLSVQGLVVDVSMNDCMSNSVSLR